MPLLQLVRERRGRALAACPDCILLDLSLPGAYGHEVCRSIRQESNVPIIVLTSSDSEFDEVMSMNVGADDYVVKPYRPAALLARIDRALTRSESADPARGRLEHDGVSLDPVRAEVSYRGESVELSRNELLILRILMESAGSIISRSELMDELWQTDAFVDDNTLTVNVNRLRRSLRRWRARGFHRHPPRPRLRGPMSASIPGNAAATQVHPPAQRPGSPAAAPGSPADSPHGPAPASPAPRRPPPV